MLRHCKKFVCEPARFENKMFTQMNKYIPIFTTGWTYISADFAQIELRVLAHVTSLLKSDDKIQKN